MILDRMLDGLPRHMRGTIDRTFDNLKMMVAVHNPKVACSMLPSAFRGLILRRGKGEGAVAMPSGHAVHFSLEYGTDFPEMYQLYRRAVARQWDADRDLDWSIDVDPMNPEVPIIDETMVPLALIAEQGIALTAREGQKLKADVATWMLSQFMHGEQGALYASAQVTEGVEWMDAKFYGATQVMDEGRHLETFLRYLETKMNKVYQCNDNLFVILDDLMTDSRWDIKFLGMQIMIEGLALGAFSTLYNSTREPLLKEALKYIIQDEARHVHYGVLALREQIKRLSDAERREREDWAFEVAILMRNRFLAHEIYYEWFEGQMRLKAWNKVMMTSPGMLKFRSIMFRRLIPNLDYIGLMSDRVHHLYAREGLLVYAGGKNAAQLSEEDLIRDNDVLAAEGAELERLRVGA